MGGRSMKRAMKVILAGLAVVSMGSILPALAAGDLVANPETIFAKGMKWSERNGENTGVLQLNLHGSAIINWNGTTYYGHWERVDKYRVKTTWESGGPPGSVWSLRETGDSAVPYIASRREP
jgi:hypothetical protein